MNPLRRTRSANTASTLANTSSSLNPITAHYSLNATLKEAFFKLCESDQYSTALAVGMQFCRVALFEIPLHGYYNSPKYEDLKLQNSKEAVQVVDSLVVNILPRVQCYEQRKDGSTSTDLMSKLQEIKILRESAYDNIKSLQGPNDTNIFARKNQIKKDTKDKLNSSWLSKAFRYSVDDPCPPGIPCPMSNPLAMVDEDTVENSEIEHSIIDVSKTPNEKSSTFAASERLMARQRPAMELERANSAPAILFKTKLNKSHSSLRNITEEKGVDSPTPSVLGDTQDNGNKSDEAQFQSDLQRTLYLSNLELQRHSLQHSFTSPSQDLPKNNLQQASSPSELYKTNFRKMFRAKIIQVDLLDTFQGRIRESTNGCTVIAPLMAIHHLCDTESLRSRNPLLLEMNNRSYYDSNNPADNDQYDTSKSFDGIGIENDVIMAVIDIQAPRVLPKVRGHLRLHQDALIIPSDVHDYLIDENYLHQNQFVGVYGGNLLDSKHLESFLHDFTEFGSKDIEQKAKNGGEMKKLAATLYFHEHVICIHRITRGTIANSNLQPHEMKEPKKVFFRRFRSNGKKTRKQKEKDVEVQKKDLLFFDIVDSLPSAKMLSNLKGNDDVQGSGWLRRTARIRCYGKKALRACLMWYAYSKFTHDDRRFIDSYQFDGNNVDFDPRVFQAFVWSE